MRDHLLDGLRLFVHPVVVGSGIRLFVSESDPAELELTDSPAYDTVSSHSPTGRRRVTFRAVARASASIQPGAGR